MNGKQILIWTLAEQDTSVKRPGPDGGGGIGSVSFEIIARALELKRKCRNAKIVSVLLGPAMPEEELQPLIRAGADEVLFFHDGRLAHFSARIQASILAEAVTAHSPDVFLAAATSYGRTLMPYLAVKVHAGLTADCTELDIEPETGALYQTRPAVGGNILATIHTPDVRPQMATVRPHSTQLPPQEPSRTGEIRSVRPDERHFCDDVAFEGVEEIAGGERNVSDARIIVSGGRGMKGAAGFEQLEEIAGVLGAALGGSREAVDRGWIGYPHQIGLSGKTVSPELYLAVGISGSIQHLAGMQTSRHVVAINSDPDAQMLRVADLSVVGNLFEILPELIRELRKRKNGNG